MTITSITSALAVVAASAVVVRAWQNPPPPPPPQTPPAPQQPPVFRSTVELVHLDVSVLDRDRRPVRGLSQADFTVFEDGRPRLLSAFSAIDVPDTADPPALWMRDIAPDVRSNVMKDSRLFVIVLDDALIPMDPRMTRDAKAIVTELVNRLGPTDLAAVVLTGDNRNAQDFTNDHGRLLAVLDKFSPGLATYDPVIGGPPGLSGTDDYYYEASVGTLRNVVDFLIAVPQHRKALVWVSPGVPIDVSAAAPMQAGSATGSVADAPSLVSRETQLRLIEDVQDVFRRAQRANVTVFPIDPSGPGGMEQYIFSRLASRNAGPQAMAQAKARATMMQDAIVAMAANTGGLAAMNTGDFAAAVAQVYRENSAYYLLGFEPASTRADGALHRIEVKVNRPGVEVRTRSGYYAPEPVRVTERARSAQASPLAAALASLLPHPDLPMQVTVAPFAYVPQPIAPNDPDRKAKEKAASDKAKIRNLATVAIVLGVKQRVREESATARIVEDVELLTSAFTPEGSARGTSRQTAHVAIRQGTTGEVGYEILTRIDLAPGRYELRLATYSGALEKTGSVFTSVIVPNFAEAPLSLSGVMVHKTPGLTAGPRGGLREILPITPTSDRDFLRTDKVTMLLRVYQGGQGRVAPVTLSTRIVNAEDRAVVDTTETLDVSRFGSGRSADVQVPIAVPTLRPGPHVATFTATLGRTVEKRDVRFTIR